MVTIEQVAEAILHQDAIVVRDMVQRFLQQQPTLVHITLPQTDDPQRLAISAALLELFAERSQQAPPSWTQTIPALSEPLYLVRAAHHMKRLRTLCETQAPPPLRKRRLYAPPNYLQFV